MQLTRMPVNRCKDGRPTANNVRLINRSDVIRRIFEVHGLGISLNDVHAHLASEGELKVSSALIHQVRRKLLVK